MLYSSCALSEETRAIIPSKDMHDVAVAIQMHNLRNADCTTGFHMTSLNFKLQNY